MISRLQIQNFQSHDATDLQLVPGVNVLVGSSDSGKSAVLRGLGWVATNRPRGTSFIRHGSDGDCQVTVTTDAGTITRLRSKSANQYILNGEVLEAMRAEVPADVAAALNLTDINIAGQFDGHFLLTDSPGNIAKAINDSAHLEEAEACASKLASDQRAVQASVREWEEKRNAVNGVLSQFPDLDGYRARLDTAVSLDGKLDHLRPNLASLRGIITEVREIYREIDALGKPIDWEDACERAETAAKEIYQLTVRREVLESHVNALRTAEATLAGLPAVRGDDLEKAGILATEIANAGESLSVLDGLLSSIQSVEDRIAEAAKLAGEQEAEYKNEMGRLNICPACGQSLDSPEAKTHLLEHCDG